MMTLMVSCADKNEELLDHYNEISSNKVGMAYKDMYQELDEESLRYVNFFKNSKNLNFKKIEETW